MDIAEFVVARLDEDQAAAENAAFDKFDRQPWATTSSAFVAAHIARYDPARVLRDVEAKRALLALHMKRGEMVGNVYCAEDWSEPPCLTVRIMAEPYAEHPDYKPTWAVEHYDRRRGGQSWSVEHSA